ncbi:adenine deaminase [Falsiroseomonas sp. HW251]|uniref:adenine deaminase n=1 Tax=Falsiroseomonas sp. HW251 TaxID=3390998 RepID=UPI003D317613
MNDPIDPAIRARAVQAARGSARFDRLLTGGTVVDVATGELRPADIGIVGSMIASVHPPGTREDADQVHDVAGRFLAPGFIDSHLHYESSFMAPADYAASVVPAGTTTCVWDPHELANVLGLDGVRWAIEASRDLPLRSLIAAPSCVPSAPGLEMAGAEIGATEMAEMLAWPEICGVAEVMDMPGVLRGTAHMTGIVGAGLASGKNVNGHARGMVDGDLQAYASAGVTSCHEIISPEDFVQKLRTGMTVELRGSHDYVLPQVLTQLAALPMLPPNLVLCTDDIFPDELIEKGGLRDTIARIIARGVNPIAAIRCATFHAALRLKRDDIGLIGAGRQADIVVLSELTSITVDRVFTAGRLVAQDGKLIEPPRRSPGPTNTVKLSPQPIESFMPKVNGVGDGRARLRKIVGARHGKWGVLEAEVRNGYAVLPTDHALITIIHRHGRAPAVPQRSIIEGWGTLHGAIATTLSHDSHNLLVLGRDAADMQAAANALIACGGGMAVARNGKVTALVPLPIAGLLAETPPEETAANFAQLRAEADQVVDWQPPFRVFRMMTGLSLACNPAPHPTDLGLTDGATGEVFDPAEPLPA